LAVKEIRRGADAIEETFLHCSNIDPIMAREFIKAIAVTREKEEKEIAGDLNEKRNVNFDAALKVIKTF